MIKPTAKDLVLDFTMTTLSICIACKHRTSCTLAPLLNLPVKQCKLFEEADPIQQAFNHAIYRANARKKLKANCA